MKIAHTIVAYHSDDPRAADLVGSLSLNNSDFAQILQSLRDKSHDTNIRGLATAGLIETLFNSFDASSPPGPIRTHISSLLGELNNQYASVPVPSVWYLPIRPTENSSPTMRDVAAAYARKLNASPGSPLPVHPLTKITGGQITSDSLRGNVIVYDFWATWCVVCITNHPLLDAMRKHLAGLPFRVVGVSVDDKPQLVADFYRDQPDALRDQLYVGPHSPVLQDWGVSLYPTYIIVDRNGVVAARADASSIGSPAIEALLRRLATQPLNVPHA
jgi:thiol-disulfide isomerase/thioredoxin